MNKLFIIFAFVCCTNACFTMPPKKVLPSGWHLFWPPIDSEYEHNVHDCPVTYISVFKYSYYVRESVGKVHTRSIMGYNVCCPKDNSCAPPPRSKADKEEWGE